MTIRTFSTEARRRGHVGCRTGNTRHPQGGTQSSQGLGIIFQIWAAKPLVSLSRQSQLALYWGRTSGADTGCLGGDIQAPGKGDTGLTTNIFQVLGVQEGVNEQAHSKVIPGAKAGATESYVCGKDVTVPVFTLQSREEKLQTMREDRVRFLDLLNSLFV